MPKVFLSAGHGESDPGAVSNGAKEKDLNLSIALACRDILVRHGVEAKMSRTKDENDPLKEGKSRNAMNARPTSQFQSITTLEAVTEQKLSIITAAELPKRLPKTSFVRS